MFSFDKVYATDLVVPIGGSTDGDSVVFANNADKPCCVGALIKYAPGDAAHSLNVKIQYASASLTGSDWYDTLSDQSIDLTGAGGDTFTFVELSTPGGVSRFRLVFTSSGAGGTDDEVSVVLTGLPIKGVS